MYFSTRYENGILDYEGFDCKKCSYYQSIIFVTIVV